MTTGTFTAVSNEQLLDCAESLEAASYSMHGSAYQPARKAYKIMRYLASSREMGPDDIEILKSLVPEMRYFAETLYQPHGETMQKAARLLTQVLEEH